MLFRKGSAGSCEPSTLKKRDDFNVFVSKRFKYVRIQLRSPQTDEVALGFILHQVEAKKLAETLLAIAQTAPDPLFRDHEQLATNGAFLRDLPSQSEVVDPEFGINVAKKP